MFQCEHINTLRDQVEGELSVALFLSPEKRVTKNHDSSAESEKKTPYILFLIRSLFHQHFHQTNLTLPKTPWVKDAGKGDSFWKCYIFQQDKRLPIWINTHWLLFDRFRFVTRQEFEGEIQGELYTPTKTVGSFWRGESFWFWATIFPQTCSWGEFLLHSKLAERWTIWIRISFETAVFFFAFSICIAYFPWFNLIPRLPR